MRSFSVTIYDENECHVLRSIVPDVCNDCTTAHVNWRNSLSSERKNVWLKLLNIISDVSIVIKEVSRLDADD